MEFKSMYINTHASQVYKINKRPKCIIFWIIIYFKEAKEAISFYIFTLKKYALQNIVSEIFFSFEVF